MKEVTSDGKRLSVEGSCPLMYAWFDEKCWGAAHGLAGIMHVLMDMELSLEEQECVKGTLRYMIENRLPSGNYPLTEGDGAPTVLFFGAMVLLVLLSPLLKLTR